MKSIFNPTVPFQIGIDGWEKPADVTKVADISYEFKRRELVNLSGEAAIFISKKDFTVAVNTWCQRVRMFNEKFNYEGDDYYILMVAKPTTSAESRHCKIINLDAVEALVADNTAVSAINLVREYVNRGTEVKRLPVLNIGDMFPKIHGYRNINTGEIMGYFPVQQLEEAIDLGYEGDEKHPAMIGKLLQGSNDVWTPDAPGTLGQVVLEMFNFDACGPFETTLPPVIEEVLRNYDPVSGYWNFENGQKLREKHGAIGLDLVLVLLDQHNITMHGNGIPGWLGPLGQFLVTNIPDQA